VAATSAIEWTDATWNPWMGCERVSPGCAHCYMYREQRQYGHDPEALRRSKTKFFEPLRWREPGLVFTCSWSDWFHPGPMRGGTKRGLSFGKRRISLTRSSRSGPNS
jgi:protein gp37